MKNLDDAFTYGDQFLYNKPTEEELGKVNVETEVEFMVIVLIHQASSTVPPLSTPIIDLTQPKQVSPPIQEPIFTATTTTITTTLPPPPPPQQQSTTDSALAARVSALEHICANFEKKNKVQDQTAQALSSRIFTLENHDLYSKIDKYINENVKEAVQDALQAPVCERFRELSEFEMKEILRDWMFESGSYQLQPEHTALYDALEASMDRENKEEFMDATTKSCKRRRDDQDPPPPPPKDLDQSKKKRHASDASSSQQPQAQTLSAWKTIDIRDAPSSSSKQKPDSQTEQLIDNIPIPDDMHLSDSKDTGVDHLPKIKTRPDWLKPIPEEEMPETPEPDWVIPLNDLPEPDAITKSYQDLEENKLLQKTRDMGSFIKWYCKWIGKSKLTKADLEGPTFKLVRPFHKNNISLQFQMEECHLLLTDKNDLTNPEGDRVVPDVRKPLPLGGPPDRRHALSISKLKVAYYQDFGLEELVPSLWIESEREYNKSSHQKHVEDLQLGIESYQTKLKLTQLNWDASDFLFKEDYTIIHNSRAIIYRDRNDQKKMMRENEVHKFSNGTLTRILEKLDHMVKDFRLFKFNSGMENRIWSEDDKRRSKEFIEVIERRLKIRRIFRNLEGFVSGRLRDVYYRLI
ncbi:hypothetical protein Tco_1267042 [Tanacetum coccineum]